MPQGVASVDSWLDQLQYVAAQLLFQQIGSAEENMVNERVGIGSWSTG